jgi:hypothetical protein
MESPWFAGILPQLNSMRGKGSYSFVRHISCFFQSQEASQYYEGPHEGTEAGNVLFILQPFWYAEVFAENNGG